MYEIWLLKGFTKKPDCAAIEISDTSHLQVKTKVFPSTKVTNVSSRKNIVFSRALLTVHPKMVIPPGFICKYITAPYRVSYKVLPTALNTNNSFVVPCRF